MVNHAVPTEKLCVPFDLHPVVERVSVFKYLYHTTQDAHCQDDFPSFGTEAACNIKCERTNTTSNDGYAFYRIYFFTIKSPKAQGGRENEARFF